MPNHDRAQFSLYPKGANTPTSRPTLHTPWHYKSTLDAARKMYTTEGLASFYSGLTPALLGLTHVAVQFPAYEYLKVKFTGRPMGGAPGDEGGDKKNHWFGILSATILSKVLASSATYPHEVIRTRLQTQRRTVVAPGSGSGNGTGNGAPQLPRYRGVVMTFRTILREEGWRAFYAGMGTNMMRAVPAATVTMCTYEFTMSQLKLARIRGLQKQAMYDERLDMSDAAN
jgi:solute carrier family 25 folate transporter 32